MDCGLIKDVFLPASSDILKTPQQSSAVYILNSNMHILVATCASRASDIISMVVVARD